MQRLSQINLNALRVAESAARHGNFTRAAEEACITPSAVSQQIKKLEDQLEFRIFDRQRNVVSLTPEGQEFMPAVRQALEQIVTARNRIVGRGRHSILKVSVLPTFAIRWLLPRLGSFQREHPDLRIHLSHSYEAVDFEREDFDLAIRYGTGDFAGLYAQLLFLEDLIPVCSPRLLAETLPRKQAGDLEPPDLARFTLLHSATCSINWRRWLERARATEVLEQSPSMQFDTCLLTFDAAVAGLGFAVANRPYVAADIQAGRLVAPFDTRLPNRNGWHLVCPESHRGAAAVRAFESWLMDEAGKESSAPALLSAAQ